MSAQIDLRKVNILIRGCNLRCPMCSVNANAKDVPQLLRDYPGASKGPELSLQEYKDFLEQIKDLKPSVSIGGGEPFLFKDMVSLIDHIKNDLHLNVGVTSNGTLFDEARLQAFANTGTGITLSIDGLQEEHDRIRGQGNFEKTVSVLKTLQQWKKEGRFKGDVNTLFVITQNNFQELEPVADFLLGELQVSAHTMSFLLFNSQDVLAEHNQWAQSHFTDPVYQIQATRGGVVSREEIQKFDLDYIWDKKEKLQKRYSRIHFEPNFKSREDLQTYFHTNDVMDDYFAPSCQLASHQITLLSNGDIVFYPGCFEIKCGNIRENSFKDIWNVSIMKNLRKVLQQDLSPICSHCCGNRLVKHKEHFENPLGGL